MKMDFIDDFIQEYKNNPCLWRANSTDYKNRSKRQEAYQKLIEVAASHGEHYNIERTKQKINNLRCAFRHQLKKYVELKNNDDEPYCPKRRYFESLMFLRDEENIERKPRQSTVAIDYAKSAVELEITSDESSLCRPTANQNQKEQITIESVEINPSDVEKMLGGGGGLKPTTTVVETLAPSMPHIGDTLELGQTVVVNKDQLDTEIYYFESKEPERDTTINTTTIHTTTAVNNVAKKVNHHNNSRKRSTSLSSQQSNDTAVSPPAAKSLKLDFNAMDFEKLFSLACRSIHQQQQDEHDDHYTHLGQIIAHKLRSMDPLQAMYAEKIISDVLFQGQLKQLTTQIAQAGSFSDGSVVVLANNNAAHNSNSQQSTSK